MPLFKSSGSFLFLFSSFSKLQNFSQKSIFFYQTNVMSFTSEVHIRIERKKNLISISLLFLFFVDCQYLFFFSNDLKVSGSNSSSSSSQSQMRVFAKKIKSCFFFPSNSWERTRIMQRTIIWQKKMFWNQKNYF